MVEALTQFAAHLLIKQKGLVAGKQVGLQDPDLLNGVEDFMEELFVVLPVDFEVFGLGLNQHHFPLVMKLRRDLDPLLVRVQMEFLGDQLQAVLLDHESLVLKRHFHQDFLIQTKFEVKFGLGKNFEFQVNVQRTINLFLGAQTYLPDSSVIVQKLHFWGHFLFLDVLEIE